MQELLVALSNDLVVTAGQPLPTRFRILQFGTTTTEKGDIHFDKESAARVLANASKRTKKLPFDYEHRALSAAMSGTGEAPAAGWYSLEVNEDGLYATNVDWTKRAAAYLEANEYKHFSPAFGLDEKRRPTRLVNMALTNIPAIHGSEPLLAASAALLLHLNPDPAASGTENKPMKTLLAALSLGETASEAEALAALTALRTKEKEILSLTGCASLSEAFGKTAAWKLAAEKVESLVGELKSLKEKEAKVEILSLVAEGVKAGKIPPALKPFWEGQNKETLNAFLSAAPVLAGGTTAVTQPNEGDASVVTLTADDQKMAKLLGVDLVELAKVKKEHTQPTA